MKKNAVQRVPLQKKIEGFVIAIPSTRELYPDFCETIMVPPQCLYRVEQIVLDPVSAPYFEIGNFAIGSRIQLSGMIPATVFAPSPVADPAHPVSNAPRIKFITCEPALFISFAVRNKSDRPRTFGGGCFVGSAMM